MTPSYNLLSLKYFFLHLVAGFLLDHVQFRVMMPVISLLLTINLASIYFIAQHSFIGLIVSVWLIYLLGFAHFATIPAQVLVDNFHSRVTIINGYIDYLLPDIYWKSNTSEFIFSDIEFVSWQPRTRCAGRHRVSRDLFLRSSGRDQ